MNITKRLRSFYRSIPIKPIFLRTIYFYVRRLIDRNRVVVKTRGGITYELHLNEFIDSDIYYYGCFEEETTRAIERIVKPGMIVLDIGANIGAHTLPSAKIVGPDEKVIAFEPMGWAQKKLERNLELNSFTNIVIEKIALSNKSIIGAADFRTSWNIFDGTPKIVARQEEVAFEKLDNYVNDHNLSAVDFIKLDVDGFEFKILEGAVETLKRFNPIISMELGNWTLEKQGDKLKDLVVLLNSLGYDFYRESDFVKLPDINSILCEFPDPQTWTINVIAAHFSKKQQMLASLNECEWKQNERN